ncbi:copper amine oxidase N-terminal domain-containing protein [Paenibacillus sp. N3.4]|uniref:copper amine oxidase N-terminal domain-containing protein n=1 Tax=Paenibacillus sp. N3.4 TaxID=2603222 RepID=UPI00164F8F6B|nr:copper amine oxidase N-terminal domain-containing protein [Paenibacillus sp. N3.4]
MKSPEGVTLVPLRKVAEGLGYEVKWITSEFAAELNKGAEWTNVIVGKNAYFYGKLAPITLEAAPVIQNESLYVPLTFVSDILHADVRNGDSGDIHIEKLK